MKIATFQFVILLIAVYGPIMWITYFSSRINIIGPAHKWHQKNGKSSGIVGFLAAAVTVSTLMFAALGLVFNLLDQRTSPWYFACIMLAMGAMWLLAKRNVRRQSLLPAGA